MGKSRTDWKTISEFQSEKQDDCGQEEKPQR